MIDFLKIKGLRNPMCHFLTFNHTFVDIHLNLITSEEGKLHNKN